MMNAYYNYLILASVSISIFYLAYFFFFRKEQNFKLVRIFQISAIQFSLIIPLNPFALNVPYINEVNPIIENTKQSNTSLAETIENSKPLTELPLNQSVIPEKIAKPIDYKGILSKIYLIISALILTRLILSIGKILFFYFNSVKSKYQKHTIVLLDKRIIAFSFFHWIFVDKLNTDSDIEQIIKHEKIHASQYHSIDLLLSELLVATMWFNPFAWMFKKALQQVHEFLADEGVINSGFDKLEYQTLLVNQAAEERLVAVSSNFSYSLIKRRMMMMSKTKKRGSSAIKLMVLIPIMSLLFITSAGLKTPYVIKPKASEKLLVSKASIFKSESVKIKPVKNENLINKTPNKKESAKDTTPANQKYIAAVSPTKMNVLYIGVDNPLSIAVTGADKDKITVEIDNGKIIGENGNYIVRVKTLGVTTITVKVDGKIISHSIFRVKKLPDPIAIIKGKWNVHELTRQELIEAGGIECLMTNFDFDLQFEVVGFEFSMVTTGGFMEFLKTSGSNFSEEQINLINLYGESGRKIYIDDIQVKAPDGTIRKLGSLVIKIV